MARKNLWQDVGLAAVAALMVALLAGQAAATVDLGSWGVSPFSGSGTPYDVHMAWQPAGGPAMTTWWKEENNYSPIDYPSVHHVPSPGNQAGEAFDLEALYYRKSGTNLQVLLVTSIGYKKDSTEIPGVSYYGGGQYWYRLGDLFLNTNAKQDSTWDYAVASTNYNEGLKPGTTTRKIQWWAYDAKEEKYVVFDHSATPGTIYQIAYNGTPSDPDGSPISQIVTVVDRNAPGGGWAIVDDGGNKTGETGTFDHLGYGADFNREDDLRPWVVNPAGAGVTNEGVLGTLNWDIISYADKPGGGYLLGTPDTIRNENNTWFYEYTIPLAALGLDENYDLSNLGLHITTECGNDLILAGEGVGGSPPIPEPVTAAGLVLGLGGLVGYIRRRRA